MKHIKNRKKKLQCINISQNKLFFCFQNPHILQDSIDIFRNTPLVDFFGPHLKLKKKFINLTIFFKNISVLFPALFLAQKLLSLYPQQVLLNIGIGASF